MVENESNIVNNINDSFMIDFNKISSDINITDSDEVEEEDSKIERELMIKEIEELDNSNDEYYKLDPNIFIKNNRLNIKQDIKTNKLELINMNQLETKIQNSYESNLMNKNSRLPVLSKEINPNQSVYDRKTISSLSHFNDNLLINSVPCDNILNKSQQQMKQFQLTQRKNIFDISHKPSIINLPIRAKTAVIVTSASTSFNRSNLINCDEMIRNLGDLPKKTTKDHLNSIDINKNSNNQHQSLLSASLSSLNQLKRNKNLSKSLNDLSKCLSFDKSVTNNHDLNHKQIRDPIESNESEFKTQELNNNNESTTDDKNYLITEKLFNLQERENTNFSIKLTYDHPFDSVNRFGALTPHTYTDMDMSVIEPNLKLAEINARINKELTIVDLELTDLQLSNRRFLNKNYLITGSFYNQEETTNDDDETCQIQRVRSEQVTPELYDIPERPIINIYAELKPPNKVKLNKTKRFLKTLISNTDSLSSTTTSSNPKIPKLLASRQERTKKKLSNSNKQTPISSTVTIKSQLKTPIKQPRLTKSNLKQLNANTTTANNTTTNKNLIGSRYLITKSMSLENNHLVRKKSSKSHDSKSTNRHDTSDAQSLFKSDDGTSIMSRDKDHLDYLNFRDEYLKRIESLLINFKEKEIVNKESHSPVNTSRRSSSKLTNNIKTQNSNFNNNNNSQLNPKKNLLKEFKYCILSDLKIGEGEFGETFQGYRYDLGTPIKIAAKRLKTIKDRDNDQNSINFLSEISVLTQLDKHDYVIEYLGVHKFESTMYIIFEYAEKGDLKHLLDQCRKNMKRELYLNGLFKVKIAYEIASGMEYIHSLDIVHKDLAARNILLDKDFCCKVADFGCCKNDFLKKRPIRWMSPESLCKLLFSASSDVWSYGVLLWEIYTYGMTPYPGMTDDEVIGRINQWYRLYKPHECPNEIYSIMLSCWKEFHKARPRFSNIKHKLKDIYKSMHDSHHFLTANVLTLTNSNNITNTTTTTNTTNNNIISNLSNNSLINSINLKSNTNSNSNLINL